MMWDPFPKPLGQIFEPDASEGPLERRPRWAPEMVPKDGIELSPPEYYWTSRQILRIGQHTYEEYMFRKVLAEQSHPEQKDPPKEDEPYVATSAEPSGRGEIGRIETIERFLSRLFPNWQMPGVSEYVLKVNASAPPPAPTSTRTKVKPPKEVNPSESAPIHVAESEGSHVYGSNPLTDNCKYALVHGTPSEYNPSGMWVVHEFYNDMDE